MAADTVVLVAAGGLAREALAAVRASGELRVIGMVDDDPSLAGSRIDGVEILGGLDAVDALTDCGYLICAGAGRTRAVIAGRLAERGVGPERFATVVHPTASIPSGTVVGVGSIVLAGVVVTANAALGDHLVAMPHAVITHDADIGDFVTLCANVSLGGGVTLGPRAYLGMGASVRQGVRIGADATLGMGSVLLTDLPAGEIWAGVPAAPLRPKAMS